MVHYIRFLKQPKLYLTAGKGFAVKALVTITTDLGDSFYPDRILLSVRLANSEVCKSPSQTVLWKQNSRNVWIEIHIDRVSSMRWPMQMWVTAGNTGLYQGDKLDMERIPPIISIWSAPFDSDVNQAASKFVVRQFELARGCCLKIHEETGDSIARHVWDGGIALVASLEDIVLRSSYLDWPPLTARTSIPHASEFKVLELGSGCGLVGIALAKVQSNCHVLLTDLAEAMELLSVNISQGLGDLAPNSMITEGILDWDDDLPEFVAKAQFDLILVSECIYNSDSIPVLVKTLAALVAKSPLALIVVATKARHDSEFIFFDLIAQAGIINIGHQAMPLPECSSNKTKQALDHVDTYFFRGKDAAHQSGHE